LSVSPCVLIPVYDHSEKLPRIVGRLRESGLFCLLVDDGSSPDHAARLAALAAGDAGVLVTRHRENRGKGAAVKTGLFKARALGFSHALQIDADGQHDLGDVPRFLQAARRHPDAVICGRPVFDRSIPKGRYYSRYLTHLWVWINTLSFAIPDAMCGFRLYPLERLIPLLENEPTGERMDFDIEVLVRLHWRGAPMVWLPTRVRYDPKGVSHFRPLEDNWRISRMHARLFFTMLRRQLLGGKR